MDGFGARLDVGSAPFQHSLGRERTFHRRLPLDRDDARFSQRRRCWGDSSGRLPPSIVAPIMSSSFGLALGIISGLLLLGALSVWLIDVETKSQALE